MKGDIQMEMDKYFLLQVQKLLKGKTQEYRGEFMRRLHKANDYMNRTGGSIHSRQFAVLLMLDLDKEFKNEGNETNE
jgi:hypothetical protein